MLDYSVLPPEQQKRAENLREYITVELSNNRNPNPNAVKALETLNDAVYAKKGTSAMGSTNAPETAVKTPSEAPQNLVAEAAELAVAIEMAEANGIKPRPQDVQRLAEIDAAARARLTPEQYESAQVHFNQAKVEAFETFNLQQKNRDEQAQQQHEQAEITQRANVLANALRSVSGDGKMTVPLETEEQLNDFREGNKVTVDSGKSRFPKAALSKQIKEQFGTTYRTHLKRLDEVAELELVDPDRADKLREEYGFDAETTKAWREGEGLRLGMAERMAKLDEDMPEEIELEPTEDDRRHMDLHTAAAEQGAFMAEQSLDDFVEDNQQLLAEETRHGDVARAALAVESQQEV